MKKIIIIIVFISIIINMVGCSIQTKKISLYDEINQIKKWGNPYDNNNSDTNSWLSQTADVPSFPSSYKLDTRQQTMESPIFIGADPRLQGYGDSKYDYGLSYRQLDDRSLEDIRAERQRGTLGSLSNITRIVCLLIIILISLAFLSKGKLINKKKFYDYQ